ncbi:AAA family ATPase [Methylobacterium sp. WL122]|nr:AAA family ATPase [Methylobacterium sp. WL122]
MKQDEQGNQNLDALQAAKPIVEGDAIPETLENCIAELHALVGLDNIKSEVETLINLARVFASRRRMGMPVPPMSHHLVLAGNPGTGKTTVARIISKVYHILGILSTNKFVEVDRSGLVANFVGQTATKTKSVIDSALGGVLFIDEAYALTRGTMNDYGDEAIEVILKAMEDNRGDLIIIVAGYSEKMAGFLEFNPGLKSRFRQTLVFPDYTPQQMCDIYLRMATTNGYRLDLEAQSALEARLETVWKNRDENFANARDVRNLFERTIARQADRIIAVGDYAVNALSLIKREDIHA